MGKQWKQCQTFIFMGSKITADGDCSYEIKRCLLLGRKVMTNLDSIFKSRHYFVNRGLSSQGYGSSSSHVWMWELDYKESWVPKNSCFWTVVLEKTLESPLNCKEIQPFHPDGDQSWMFIGRTDVEGETPIFWPPHAKNWLIGKDPDAGKDWRWKKGMTEDEMVGWHCQLNELGVAAAHGVARNRTWLSNWTELNWLPVIEKNGKMPFAATWIQL